MSTFPGVDSAAKHPKMKLSDIIVPADKIATEPQNASQSTTLNKPSMILDDWLFLGNRWHAKSRDILENMHITHILNITATIPCSYPDIIQYAHIKVFDEGSVKLYDYFEAAACFIDLCNPLKYDLAKEPNKRKRRILVHCAMGISRSATITVAYLMSRCYTLNNTEQKIMNHIQQQLQLVDKDIESKLIENDLDVSGWTQDVFDKHRDNLDLTKRTRTEYTKKDKIEHTNEEKENESDNTLICGGLTLGEAYMFVLERRSIICPNVGFCRQLDAWEKLVWSTTDSTLYQVPFFRPNLDVNQKKSGVKKMNDESSQCSKQCCVVL